MVTEDYVSFETAKLLEAKGFKGDINAYYHIYDNGTKVCSMQEFNHSEAPHLYIPAPTLQMAMKWLREIHNLVINIDGDVNGYFCSFSRITKDASGFIVNVEDCGVLTSYFKFYEEAAEAGIKYCLENLI